MELFCSLCLYKTTSTQDLLEHSNKKHQPQQYISEQKITYGTCCICSHKMSILDLEAHILKNHNEIFGQAAEVKITFSIFVRN